jgi:hypothetical protein
MRGCAWLAGIDRHALHVPCTSRLGSLAKPYLRWSLQGPGAFTLVIVFGIGFVLPHWSRNLWDVFCFFAVIMSFSELDVLAKGLHEPGELNSESASLQAFEARLTSQEAALEKVQDQQALLVDQQARLLEHVTALARHLVRSPVERALSTFEPAGLTASLAVPLVRPTNTSETAFSTLSGQDASAVNSSACVFSGEVMPLPPSAPAGVTSASPFTF